MLGIIDAVWKRINAAVKTAVNDAVDVSVRRELQRSEEALKKAFHEQFKTYRREKEKELGLIQAKSNSVVLGMVELEQKVGEVAYQNRFNKRMIQLLRIDLEEKYGEQRVKEKMAELEAEVRGELGPSPSELLSQSPTADTDLHGLLMTLAKGGEEPPKSL